MTALSEPPTRQLAPPPTYDLGLSNLAHWGLLQAFDFASRPQSPDKPQHAWMRPLPVQDSDAPLSSNDPWEWVGAEAAEIMVDGQPFRLSFVFIGKCPSNCTSPAIDPSLAIDGHASCIPTLAPDLLSYAELDAVSRAAYINWIERGRTDPAVPTAFLMHCVYSFEIALCRAPNQARDGRLAGAVHRELERLMQLHAHDADFISYARALVELCTELGLCGPLPAIPASAATNHHTDMPFRMRRYIGEALQRTPILEAETALLFLLQQPGTRLDPHTAQGFIAVHHHWTENYSYRFDGGIELYPTKMLELDYECLDGSQAKFCLDVPDPASVPVPQELREFFDQCCAEWNASRDLSAAQQAAIISQLKRAPSLTQKQAAGTLRADFDERIAGRLNGSGPALFAVEDVLADLFEGLSLPATQQIPLAVLKRMQRTLADVGVGFEPDHRYGLPAGIRPNSQIALFREEPWPFQQPTQAYRLGQAAMVLSAIGIDNFPNLEPLSADQVDRRLPYPHRFSDREVRRLQASFLAMSAATCRRPRLASWARRMKKNQRQRDIDEGFGIAFYAQAANPSVKRFARALSIALHRDDRRVQCLLGQLAIQAELDELPEGQNGDVVSFDQYRPAEEASRSHVSGTWPASVPPPPSPIEGLPLGLGEMVIALLERPQSRTELLEIAKRRHLQLNGALEQLNDWSAARVGGHLTSGHNSLRINPDVFAAVKLLARQI